MYLFTPLHISFLSVETSRQEPGLDGIGLETKSIYTLQTSVKPFLELRALVYFTTKKRFPSFKFPMYTSQRVTLRLWDLWCRTKTYIVLIKPRFFIHNLLFNSINIHFVSIKTTNRTGNLVFFFFSFLLTMVQIEFLINPLLYFQI